jgi:dUTP pyrophosphatase
MSIITFCFTSENAKTIYSGRPPQYQTPFASAFDLKAVDFGTHTPQNADLSSADFFIEPQCRLLVKTGIRIAIPIIEDEITELQIRSRSGLALKYGVCVLNGIGTIDNDYRGELGVILHNAGQEPFKINIGDRIAQGAFNPLKQCIWQKVSQEDFDANYCNTERGSGGFGSTGK